MFGGLSLFTQPFRPLLLRMSDAGLFAAIVAKRIHDLDHVRKMLLKPHLIKLDILNIDRGVYRMRTLSCRPNSCLTVIQEKKGSRNAYMTILSEPFDPAPAHKTLLEALLDARRRFGGPKTAIHDADGTKLSYDQLLTAVFALGASLRRGTSPGESVGILLPTSAASVISFLGLSAYGRIPAMLNFTSGARNLSVAVKTGQIRKIITAQKFVDVGGYEELVAKLAQEAELVKLEEVRESLTFDDKLRGAAGPYAGWLLRAKSSPASPAVLLFTSGTEGEPKGVVLSHANIVANVQQVLQHLGDILSTDDVFFSPLPTFHSFGLTGGVFLPLLGGMTAALHPSPLHVKEIPKRIRETGATILMATDTFLSQYVRASAREELKSLRYVVCGAERVKDETRQLVSKACQLEIIEGYGVTETSPVLAVNHPNRNRFGTVGQALPGVEIRLEPVAGIKNAGRLFVRGPNVMAGYMRSQAPGIVEPPQNGWHDTGDVVSIDPDGLLTIRGRLKRFAKLGGEMVSLAVVENCAYAVWPEFEHAAATLPDARKGEQIVLLTTNPAADPSDLSHWLQNHGVAELSMPKRIFSVEAIPLLGSGKMDIGAVQQLALDLFSGSQAQATPQVQ